MSTSVRPYMVSYLDNPNQEQLKQLASLHTPNVMETSSGSLNKVSRNKARMAKYTYVVVDDLEEEPAWSHQVMLAADASILIRGQESYIREKGELIVLDGYIGSGERAVGATWYYTLEGANIAGMQQVLAFPKEAGPQPFESKFTVVYTPDYCPEGVPGNQAILVDLKNWTTYIMGPDYFGESKKAMLRMLNHHVYQEGGLVLHAGAKAVTQPAGDRIMMTVMGLSGTGKTTTTFSSQGTLTEPVQDDMVCLWPNGELTVTENGCFAKIENLSEESEPVIYRGTVSKEAWLENAYLNEDHGFDFSKNILTPHEVSRYRDIFIATGADPKNVDQYIRDEVELQHILKKSDIPCVGWEFVAWTGNGRSIIPMSAIPGAADLEDLPPVKTMGILNRDEGNDACMPGIVRFTSPSQAAGYFMLGETSKTSAAGSDRGKTRSPFTQPFFPARHNQQATRFAELAATMPDVSMWLMNTGYVGGAASDVEAGKAIKVKIHHSSAMLEALLTDSVKWKIDPDFGYEIVDVDAPENKGLLKLVPKEILNPALFYLSADRWLEYTTWVSQIREARKQFLFEYEVHPNIVSAVLYDPTAME